jgi:5'-phosphate synthase pdxT subunit
VRLGDGHVITGVFIRAPRIEDVGPEVQVLATLERDGAEVPVLVRQGATWGCAFHPELTTDRTIHERFVAALMCSSATAR